MIYKTYLPKEHRALYLRAQRELSIALSNVTFLLEDHLNDVEFLNSDEYIYWYDKLIEKDVQFGIMVKLILEQLFNTKPVYYTIPSLCDCVLATEQGHYTEPLGTVNFDLNSFVDEAYVDIFQENPDMKHTRTITFQVTEDCNLACTYCYQCAKTKNKMTFEVGKELCDNILEGSKGFKDFINPDKVHTLIIDFIGGEPLLEVELIDAILTYFRRKAIAMKHPYAEYFSASMSTNGTLYFTDKVQKFIAKHGRVTSVSITLDGTKELHDKCRVFHDGMPSYDIVHMAVKYQLDKGLCPGTKITVSPDNINYLDQCLRQMISEGFKQINCNTVYEKGWEIIHAQTLYNQLKSFTDWFIENKYNPYDIRISILDEMKGCPDFETNNNNWCGGTGDMLAFDYKGDMYPCIRYMATSLGDQQKPLLIGDLKNGLFVTEEHKQIRDTLDAVTRRSQSTDSCFYCPISTGCAWCSGYNYQELGTPNARVTYSCDIHKARSLALVYFWNKNYAALDIQNVKNLWVPKNWAIPVIGQSEYSALCALVQKRSGYVNKNAVQVRYNPISYINHASTSLELESLEILKTED